MWDASKFSFNIFLLIGISRLIHNVFAKKMFDFKNVVEYTSSYSAILNKIIYQLKKVSNLTIKSAKRLFYKAMLININKKYTSFILIIETV